MYWYFYWCTYLYINTYVCIHMHTPVWNTCIYTWFICVHIQLNTCTYMRTNMGTYILRVYLYTRRICFFIYIMEYIHIHTYIHTCIYIHTYLHIYMRTCILRAYWEHIESIYICTGGNHHRQLRGTWIHACRNARKVERRWYTYVCMYVCVCVCVYLYIFLYIHIYIYI